MKHLENYLIKNEFVRQVDSPITIFGTRFSKALKQEISDVDSTAVFNKKYMVSGILNYPKTGFKKDTDIFKFLNIDILEAIRQKKCFFIFDASAEGFSAHNDNFFECLYYNCKKYYIDPSYVIFTSSNLKDENVHHGYCKEHDIKNSMHVISFPYLSNVFKIHSDINQEFEKTIKETEHNYSDKFFSSLNRHRRNERSMIQYLISNNEIKRYSLQSQDKLEEEQIHLLANTLSVKYPEINYEKVKEWNSNLPMTIDRKDFEINWAVDGKFSQIHNQTLFQLVNETWVTNFNDTSLFYSEKTFRPIHCFQPFIIFGQKGCNRYLENLGYKLYDEWFDYEFDDEEDDLERMIKIVKSLESICSKLNMLSRNQQIEWKFKNKEILIHNYVTMKNQEYSKNKVKQLILTLIEQVKNDK